MSRTVSLQFACDRIRHKMMYIDEAQKAIGSVDDSSDTRVFWCARTFESRGPDGQAVDPDACRPDRSCFCHDES